jgi:hypothetical protein
MSDNEEMPIDEEEFGEDPIFALLASEDGETIPTILDRLVTSTDSIAKHLEKQNLILVKILTSLTAKPTA